MNKHLVAACDIVILCLMAWFLTKYTGKAVAWGFLAACTLSLIGYFRGISPDKLIGIWLIRFFGLALTGLAVGNQRVAMYSGIAVTVLFVLLAIFWPKTKTAEYQQREDEAAETQQPQATKSKSQQGHALVSRPSPFWAWMRGNGWGIAAFLFLLAGIGVVGTMVYQFVYGDMYDWGTLFIKLGVMVVLFGIAYAFFLTQTGGWKDAFTGAGTFVTETAAPAVGKGLGWTVRKSFAAFVVWPLEQLWKLAGGGYGRAWQALTITVLCFAARGLLFWFGLGNHVRLPIIQILGINVGGWRLVDALFVIGLFTGMAVLILPWKQTGDKIAAKWNAT